jgi:fructokinase
LATTPLPSVAAITIVRRYPVILETVVAADIERTARTIPVMIPGCYSLIAPDVELWYKGGGMGKIVALGEVVADIYRAGSERPEELPFIARPGGAPANLAAAAARLGSVAAFIGRVGEDLFGNFILHALQACGVDVSGVRRCDPPTRTSIAFVEVSPSGERSFTFYRTSPAADELLSAEDVTRKSLSGASFVTFGSIPLLREPSRSAVRRAVELAEELDVPVAFDVNLRPHLWEGLEEARREILPLLGRARIVKLSDDEIGPLLGTEEPLAAAGRLLEAGVSLAFITLGAAGAFYAAPGFRGSVPAFSVRAVDSTGAGDAFTAAVLDHLSRGPWSEARVREAATRGAAAGALVCTAFGALGALPDAGEVEALISSGAPG